jgi:hypothetical protein
MKVVCVQNVMSFTLVSKMLEIVVLTKPIMASGNEVMLSSMET